MRVAVTTLVFCVAALLSLGMVMLYSSSMTQVGARYLTMQLIWCGLGLILCATAATLDYEWLRKLAWPIFGAAVFLLILVLIPHVGVKVNGARRWLGFGSVRFQPSEFAKLALIIVLAWYGDRFRRQMGSWRVGVLLPGAIVCAVLGLIFVEPDRGTTILVAAVSGVMLLIAGVRWKHILPPALLGLAGFGFYLLRDPMCVRRIVDGWVNLDKNKEGVAYQAYQAMLGLGSGGWFGLGLGNGRQKLGWIPFHHTDFILSVIGEELGLVATLLVVLAFVLIVVCGIYIALNARETFGTLLGAGISFLIGLQAFINIGVVTSALPNKGLPLPFISYGGSNLLLMLTCVGILLSIARHSVAGEAVQDEAVGSEELHRTRSRRAP